MGRCGLPACWWLCSHSSGQKGPASHWLLPLHSLMMAAGKRLFGKNFTFSTNFMETRKSS